MMKSLLFDWLVSPVLLLLIIIGEIYAYSRYEYLYFYLFGCFIILLCAIAFSYLTVVLPIGLIRRLLKKDLGKIESISNRYYSITAWLVLSLVIGNFIEVSLASNNFNLTFQEYMRTEVTYKLSYQYFINDNFGVLYALKKTVSSFYFLVVMVFIWAGNRVIKTKRSVDDLDKTKLKEYELAYTKATQRADGRPHFDRLSVDAGLIDMLKKRSLDRIIVTYGSDSFEAELGNFFYVYGELQNEKIAAWCSDKSAKIKLDTSNLHGGELVIDEIYI